MILVSTRPDSPTRFDPGYVYVDAGEDFGRRHAAAYGDAGIAKGSFGCSVWALDFLKDRGGSAYLPERIVAPLCNSGQLHLIPDAPIFTRNTYLVTNVQAALAWSWLDKVEDWISVVSGNTACD